MGDGATREGVSRLDIKRVSWRRCGQEVAGVSMNALRRVSLNSGGKDHLIDSIAVGSDRSLYLLDGIKTVLYRIPLSKLVPGS
jgi:hypothetical protein